MGGPHRCKLLAHYLRDVEFKQGVQRIMGEISTVRGVEWWDFMLDSVQQLVSSLNKGKRRWNSDVCAMQTALGQSTVEHISPLAEHLLTREGAPTSNAKEAYKRPPCLLQREKSKVQGDEMLCLLQRELSFNESLNETTDKSKHSQAQIKRLLRQMKERRQLTVIKSAQGELLRDPQDVGQVLARFRGCIMAPNWAYKPERDSFLAGIPGRWSTMGSLWNEPMAQMAEEALSKLDPNSAPGEDGILAGFYKLFSKEFSTRIMEVVTEVHGSRRLPPHWTMGMLRCIPKGQGKISVENQRPITLLNTKVKLITGILKMSVQDVIMTVVPASQRGFIPKRDSQPHLLLVHSQWRNGTSGVWLSLDFAKAFDSTNHALLGDFLLLLGVQKEWCEVLLDFLGSELKFLLGAMLADAVLQPKFGIKQGDPLSPTLFSLLTTLLVDDFQKKCP